MVVQVGSSAASCFASVASSPAVRGPDLYYWRGSCLRLIVSMVVLPEDSTDHYFQFCRIRVCLPACVRSVGTKKNLKNMVPPRGRYWRSCCLSCRSCCLFLYAAAAFLGLGFWLIRGIGFRGILGFLGF